MKKSTILTIVTILGLLLGTTSESVATQMGREGMPPTERGGEFARIEQPLWVKAAVTAGGLGLIGLELWWFLWSQPKSRKASD